MKRHAKPRPDPTTIRWCASVCAKRERVMIQRRHKEYPTWSDSFIDWWIGGEAVAKSLASELRLAARRGEKGARR